MRSYVDSFIGALLALGLLPLSGWAVDRMICLVPADGMGTVVKSFEVLPGTTILGARFENNDSNTVFPEVRISRGSAVEASVANAHETTTPGVVTLLWPAPIVAQAGETYLVAVRFPAGSRKEGPGRGPGIGVNDVAAPCGSFIVGEGGSLVPMRSDLAIDLVTSPAGALSKAGLGEPAAEDVAGPVQPFLRVVRRPNASATVEFGLERAGPVALRIYSVSGRLVRVLEHGDVAQGVHHRTWDGRDAQGIEVATGLYFVALHAGERRLTQKLVLGR